MSQTDEFILYASTLAGKSKRIAGMGCYCTLKQLYGVLAEEFEMPESEIKLCKGERVFRLVDLSATLGSLGIEHGASLSVLRERASGDPDIFYVCKSAFQEVKEKLKKRKEISEALVTKLTVPDDLAGEEVMVAVDMRSVGKEFEDIDEMLMELGLKGTAEAFVEAREYFEMTHSPGDDLAVEMTASEWRSMLEDGTSSMEEGEEEDLLEDEDEEEEEEFFEEGGGEFSGEEEESSGEGEEESPTKKAKMGEEELKRRRLHYKQPRPPAFAVTDYR